MAPDDIMLRQWPVPIRAQAEYVNVHQHALQPMLSASALRLLRQRHHPL